MRSKVLIAAVVALVVLSAVGLAGYRKTGITHADVDPELSIPDQYFRREGMCGTGHKWDFEYGYYTYELPQTREEVLAGISSKLKQQGFSAAQPFSFAAFERRESNGTIVRVDISQESESDMTVLSVEYAYPSVTWFGRPLPDFLK